MAAPTPATTSARMPAGRKLEIGKTALITIKGEGTDDDDIALWEQSVTPPGLDGGTKVAIGDMYNTLYRTFVPQKLVEVTDMQCTVAYDPEAYADIARAINDNTTITVHWPNGTTDTNGDRLAFYGYLKSFVPGEMNEQGQPTATITICATMWDPVNFVEAGFTFSAAA